MTHLNLYILMIRAETVGTQCLESQSENIMVLLSVRQEQKLEQYSFRTFRTLAHRLTNQGGEEKLYSSLLLKCKIKKVI